MKRNVVLAAAVLVLSLAGCAQKTTVPASQALPAATGEVKTTQDPNGNTKVRLVVHHVAPPQNLQPPKSTYVVWVETPEHQMYNLGQLKINDNRDGEILATTPLKVFRLVVTAEDFGTVTEPGPQQVLRTETIEAR